MTPNISKDIIRLFEQSPTFMAFLRGPMHRIELVNPGYMSLVGDREVIGLVAAEAIPEAIEQGFIAMLDDVFKTGKAVTANGARYDRRLEIGGEVTELYLDFVYQPIMEDNGDVSGILVQGVDVTERTRAEHALIATRNAAEAAEIAKSDLISHLSHSIHAPMRAVVELAKKLTVTPSLTLAQGECIRALLENAESVLSHVGDMIDTAGVEAHVIDLHADSFSPSALIHDVADDIAIQVCEKGLTLSVDILGDEDENLVGDTRRIGQIVTQFCSNAVRFTDQGRIRVTVNCEPTENDRTCSLTIAVADTGQGMTQEKLDTLFRQSVDMDTGLKRRYGGTGLGLSIAKMLSEAMGGEITVQSVPSEGSTFTLRLILPLADRGEEGSENALDPVRQTRILLVEDYEPNIMVATTILECLGCRVEVAVNGLSAVEKARTGSYALALMDVQMPGIDGIAATRMIRDEETVEGRKYLPIVGMTAHALIGDRERCLKAGMDYFLSKPFTAKDLEDMVQSIIDIAA